MAYISAQEDDRNRLQGQGSGRQQLGASSAPTLPGTAPPAAGDPQQAQGAASMPAPQTAGRFVNFSRFLNANRDAAQGAASNIVGDVKREGDAIQGQAQKASTAFEQNARSTIKPYVQGHMPSAGYSGPASVADTSGWGDLQKRSQALQGTVNSFQTPGGLGAVIDQNAGTAQRNVGARDLDSALIGTAGADQFASARSRYSDLASKLKALDDGSKKTVGYVNQQNDQSQKAYKDAVTQAESTFGPDAVPGITKADRINNGLTNSWESQRGWF
jgi:hypothetical protein